MSTMWESVRFACAKALLLTMLAASLSGSGAITAESSGVRVVVGRDTLSWNIVSAGADCAPRWTWPEGARSAALRIRRPDGAEVVRRIDRTDAASEGTCALELPLPTKSAEEAVLDISLAFYAAEGCAGEPVGDELVAKGIGLVGGTGGTGVSVLPTGATAEGWTHVDSRYPVLPVPAGTASITAGDEALELAHVPGWIALPGLKVGQSASLALVGAELSADATVTRVGTGLVLLIR